MFVTVGHSHPSLLLAGKVGAYQSLLCTKESRLILNLNLKVQVTISDDH